MSTSHRRLLPGLFVTVLLALSLGSAAAQQTLDRIVAVVNDDVVLASELKTEVDQISAQLRARGGGMPPQAALEQQVLERLIVQRLQLAMAQRAGIQIDDVTLNAAVRRIAEQNNMSLSQFRDALEQDGMDFAEFRESLREEIAVSRLHQRQIQSQTQVSPQEIDEYLASRADGGGREYLLGHILIATPEAASPEQIQAAQAQAEAVLAELRGGADFAVMAASHSAGQSALEGGSLGWRNAGELPTLFAELVPAMQVGQVSDLIRASNGFHIVKLQDRRDGKAQLVTQTRARHILIRTDELVTDRDARLRLETLRQRIEDGADFAELARAHSADRGSAARGGDLGWAGPGTMVPEFEQAMAALEPGQLSRPFRSPFGWHLVQVLERRQHDISDEARRMEAAERIRARKTEEATETWLRRLRDEAYVEIRLEQ